MTSRTTESHSPATSHARLAEVDRLTQAGSESVRPLVALLGEPDWSIRRSVIGALSALGDASVAALCTALQHDRRDETRIAAVVDALVGNTGNVEHAIVPLIAIGDPAVTADVAQILGRRMNASSVPALVALLGQADDNVAVAAIEALGRIGGRAAVDALVAALERGPFFRTYPAIDVLGRSGDPRAVAPLAKLLRDPLYTQEATRALGRTGDRGAVTPLAELLLSPVDGIVRTAALALADLIEGHRERYGTAHLIREALKHATSAAAVRRVAHVLSSADVEERVAMCRLLGAFQNEASAQALTRMLNGAPVVANAAAEALRQLGSGTDQALRTALEHGDSARRQILLPLLPHTGGVAEVVRCLDDPDGTVRAMACDALARLGDPSVIEIVFEQLGDPNARVVQAAIGAIQSLGSRETERLALQTARSPLHGARRAALRILAYFGYASAIDVFAEAVTDLDPRVRDVALGGLAFLEHPRARQLLLQAAQAPEERTRTAAMRGLGQCQADDVVIGALTHALEDPMPWVRYYACQSLGKLRATQATDDVCALLGDGAGQVRIAAIEALSHFGTKPALNALLAGARSSESDVQRAALVGLGLMQSSEALPALMEAASSRDVATRQVALSALGALGAPEALPVVAGAISDSDEGVRIAALGLLASWPGAPATQLLVDALRERSNRGDILRALGTPVHGRIAGVLAALGSADDELAPLLTSILGRIDPEDATGAVLEALRLPNPAARKAAAAMLAARNTRASLEALKQQAMQDPSDEVRRVCALFLSQ